MKKLLYEDVKSFIETNSECKLISTEYKGTNDKLELMCSCGNVFKVTFKIFRANNQKQCKECSFENLSEKFKKTHEEYCEEVFNLVKDEYTVLGEYTKGNVHIKMKHNKCEHEYDVTPANFLSGYRCPKCFGVPKITTDIFKDKIYDMYKDEYKVLGEYNNNSTKIKIKHEKCGCEYMVRPNDILKGNKCPKCSGLERKNLEIIKKEVYESVGNEYNVNGKYINNKSKLLFTHNTCGTSFYMNTNNFLSSKQRCPICNESKGEQVIRHWVEDNKIHFKPQYEFNDLLSDKNNPLRFDFAIFYDEEKKKLKCLIEYDGEFHYKTVKGFNTKESLALQQKYDLRKNEYCKNNNLKLIRIPYWEFDNIENILTKELL